MSKEGDEKALVKAEGEAPLMLPATGAATQVQKAEATIRGLFAAAQFRPRHWEEVSQAVQDECRVEAFALDDSSLYVIRRGGKSFQGLGIRTAEVFVRAMGNMLVEDAVVGEGETFVEIEAHAIDLQRGTVFSRTGRVAKAVWRYAKEEGQKVIRQRQKQTNDGPRTQYLVEPGPEDLQVEVRKEIAKLRREVILNHMPHGMREGIARLLSGIREKVAERDPEEQRRRLIATFAGLRPAVRQRDLEGLIGTQAEQWTEEDLVELQGVGAAIRHGDTTWKQVVAARQEPGQEEPAQGVLSEEDLEDVAREAQERQERI